MASNLSQDAGSNRRPTLKTIAELCGVGVPTVSRAMNDSPEIGEETKRRIRQIAAEIGYVPDPAGLRLRTGRTFVINLVFLISQDNQMGRIIPSIARSLLSTPFQIGITPTLSEADELASIRRVVENRMADAVIFNQTLEDDPRVMYLLDRGFPFATHGRDSLCHLHSYYDFDNGAYARQAAQLLKNRGRKYLTLFGPPHDRHYGLETFSHASEAAGRLGLQFDEVDGAYSSASIADQKEAALQFVKKHLHCDGYVCSSGPSAMAVAAALTGAGRVIGRDVDVISKGSKVFLSMIHPEIVAIEEDLQSAADFLAAATVQSITAPDLPPMQRIDQPDFSGLI